MGATFHASMHYTNVIYSFFLSVVLKRTLFNVFVVSDPCLFVHRRCLCAKHLSLSHTRLMKNLLKHL